MEREQVAAFRVARHGLHTRRRLTLAAAAACPASDFRRGSALLALAARTENLTREEYDRASDSGELVVGPSLRAAIHAVAPPHFALYGRALVATEDEELAEQLGPRLQRQPSTETIAPRDALAEVAEAIGGALAGGRALTKDELHEELRGRVRPGLLPWCPGCGSHHVAPMLWRYAGVHAGMRLDSRRRFLLESPGETPGADEAARGFLRFYGPATADEFGAWSGLPRARARRVWAQIADELVEVRVDGSLRLLLAVDAAALEAPPEARGVRLLPPRDPYLEHPDRTALTPDPAVRRRLFRAVGGPGAILQDGRLAGLWRIRARGRHAEVEVDELERIDPDELEAEAARVAELRGADSAVVVRHAGA